jgi:Kef-type K+ transport system membrane component KefB
MPEITSIILDLFIIFALAKAVGEVFLRLKQPVVIGEILVGMIIGPNALDFVGEPSGSLTNLFHGDEATAQEALSIVFEIMAALGVIVLLFFVGLDTRIDDILRVGRRAVVIAFLGVVTPFVLGLLFMILIGRPQVEAVFVGTALVATSTGITARVLRDLGFMVTQEARIIIGAAVIDDVLSLMLLTVVTSIGEGNGIHPGEIAIIATQAIGLIAFIAYFGTHGARRFSLHLTRLQIPNAPLVFAIILMLGLATLAGRMGLAAIIGAFLAGMVLAESREHFDIEREATPLYEFLVPFFFVITGTKVDLSELADLEVAAISAAITVLAVLGKVIGCGIGATGMGTRSATIVGVGMSPRGEVGLIVASIGLSLAAVSQEIFSVVVIMSIATTLIAPPLLARLFRDYQLEEERAPARFPRVIRRERRRPAPIEKPGDELSEP